MEFRGLDSHPDCEIRFVEGRGMCSECATEWMRRDEEEVNLDFRHIVCRKAGQAGNLDDVCRECMELAPA